LSLSANTTPTIESLKLPETFRLADDPRAVAVYRKRRQAAIALFRPPEDLTVSQWAEKHRVMPKGTTARPGPFHAEKFQVEMMDVILDPLIHEVIVKKSTQIGYSDAVVNNLIGYFMDIDPKPIMLVQPTIDNAKDYGKKRITPMIEATAVLRSKVREKTSRKPGNTLALKEFPGGFLKLTGANAGSGLRSDPVPIVLFDEIDGYPLDVEGEGDPIEIGTRRTDQWPDYKIVKGSTPAKPKGFSQIDKAWDRSDQRMFHVPCPACGFMQPLLWRDIEETPGEDGAPPAREFRMLYTVDEDGQVIGDSVAYLCANRECKTRIPEYRKQSMLNAGVWIPKFPGRPIAGFYLNALYSPWRQNWRALAQEWHEANEEKNPEKMKAFINLRLGETWEEQGDSLESHTLRKRCERYPEEIDVPNGVAIVTAAVDVQGDRLEVVVKGWGKAEESWLIAYQQFFGEPGQSEVWEDVDEFLLTEFRHESGKTIKIHCALVDSGGHNSDDVYRFVKGRQHRRVFALKGSSDSGKEILGKFSLNNTYRVKLFTIGTDTAKDRIFARMKIPVPGPGYMHLPDWVDDEYLAQLTSEKRVRRIRRGRTVREYVKTRARNEALDLEVYNLAALYTIGQWKLNRLGEPAGEGSSTQETPTKQGETTQNTGNSNPLRAIMGAEPWVKRW
jgi:phage terminase large subunit GpA-like protein